MAIVVSTPSVDELVAALDALRAWQHEGGPMQLHPGDVGWFWRFGAAATEAAVRTWSRDGEVVAVGLLDEPTVLRLTLAPRLRGDEELAHQLALDVGDPGRDVLPACAVALEAPADALVRELLAETGWLAGESWTPLRRDLTAPVPDTGLRVEVAGPEHVAVRVAVQRASFDRSAFTEERWRTMAAGPAYADARCLVVRDAGGEPVGAVTVWSAGRGRPGLIEPLGVHRDHRGHGHGRATTLAAAAELRRLGSSSAVVCTPTANVGGVAAYESAGFDLLPEVRDLSRAV